MRPLIGITVDHVQSQVHPRGQYQVGRATSQAVSAAGGLPVMMAADPELAPDYAQVCRGFVFTGGMDPDTAKFGEPMHPKARKVDPARQAFELALLDELNKYPGAGVPVLGVCLGMQMMALHAGGRLNQYMPETHDKPEAHQKGADHPIKVTVKDSVLGPGDAAGGEAIYSSHQQAVSDPGKMRVVAVAHDGTVEAIDGRPMYGERFYLGVQWHPEHGGEGPFNLGLFRQLVAAVRSSR